MGAENRKEVPNRSPAAILAINAEILSSQQPAEEALWPWLFVDERADVPADAYLPAFHTEGF